MILEKVKEDQMINLAISYSLIWLIIRKFLGIINLRMHRSINRSFSSANLANSPIKILALSSQRSLGYLNKIKNSPAIGSSTERQPVSKHKLKSSSSDHLNTDCSRIQLIQHRRIETLNEVMEKCMSVKRVDQLPFEKCKEANLGFTKLRCALERYQTRLKKPRGQADTERLLRKDSLTMVQDLSYQNKVKFRKDFGLCGKSIKIYRRTDKLINLVAGKLSQKDGFSN